MGAILYSSQLGSQADALIRSLDLKYLQKELMEA